MNKWSKIGITASMGACVISSIHLVNNFIFRMSTINHVTLNPKEEFFNWKFGKIAYTVTGSGSPLLLLHDLDAASSSYEWSKSIDLLSKDHTVYAIDLLGCGHSDKPNITYTTYMYTQLLNDFIINIIHKKTSIIATGTTAPIALMTAYNNSYLVDRLIFVNPISVSSALNSPSRRNIFQHHFMNVPVVGTLLYNICMSRHNIHKAFTADYFDNATVSVQSAVNAYHENAHLSGASSKFLYSSVKGHYTTASIARAISQLDNCIYIISGEKEPNTAHIHAEYTELNPAIETATIRYTKHLPQLEQPRDFVRLVRLFLS